VHAKVDAIKIIVDDTVVNTPPLSDAVVAAIVAEAHRAGARVITHVAVRDEAATAKRLIEVRTFSEAGVKLVVGTGRSRFSKEGESYTAPSPNHDPCEASPMAASSPHICRGNPRP
jgi:hypothetical protein